MRSQTNLDKVLGPQLRHKIHEYGLVPLSSVSKYLGPELEGMFSAILMKMLMILKSFPTPEIETSSWDWLQDPLDP